jgi:hypothetical protein
MKNLLILTLFVFALFIVWCADAVTVPFSAFNSNEFNVSVPNNSISINTSLFPTNGSSLYDSNGAALYQAGLSSNYSLTLSQNGSNYSTQLSLNGTNESLLIGQNNSNLTYQVGLANSNLTYQVGLNNTNLTGVASNILQNQISLAVTNSQTNVFVGNINGVSSSIPTAGLYAWYRSDTMTNLATGTTVNNITDYTGNANNTLYPYTTTTFTGTYNATIMNGLPGFSCTTGLGWTNGSFLTYGVSNATIFIVYRDTVQAVAGSSVFSIGTSAGTSWNSVCFQDYIGGLTGTEGSGSCSTWSLFNTPSQIYGFPKQNNQVGIATLRISTNSSNFDPASWDNGVQTMQAIGGSGQIGPTVVGLTNTLGIANYARNPGIIPWRGFIGEVLIYTNALTLQQIGQVHNYLKTKYGFDNKSLIVTGDSQATGVYALQTSNTVNVLTRLLPDWECSNIGLSGRTSQQVWTNLFYSVQNQKWQGSTALVIFPDFNNAGSVANATNYTYADIQLARTNGYIPFLVTEWSSYVDEGANPGYRTNYNNWIYTNWASGVMQSYGVAGIIDLSTNQFIGPLGAYTNLLWFVSTNIDGNIGHLNSNSYPQIVGPVIANSIRQYFSGLPTPGSTLTNFISGAFYVNNSGYYQSVWVQVTNITAGVVGNSLMALQITGQSTNTVGTSSLTTSLATTNLNILSDLIPPGGIYCFTNLSTGTGDGAFLGNGQLLTIP